MQAASTITISNATRAGRAAAVKAGEDDIGEADNERDRQVDTAKDHDQCLAERGNGEKRRQNEHGADGKHAAETGE